MEDAGLIRGFDVHRHQSEEADDCLALVHEVLHAELDQQRDEQFVAREDLQEVDVGGKVLVLELVVGDVREVVDGAVLAQELCGCGPTLVAVSEHVLKQIANDMVLLRIQEFIEDAAPALVTQLIQVQVVDHLPTVLLLDVHAQEDLEDGYAKAPDVAVGILKEQRLDCDIEVFDVLRASEPGLVLDTVHLDFLGRVVLRVQLLVFFDLLDDR